MRPGRTHTALDADYISALSTANRFLYAWQSHDPETVILLLTNAAKQHCSESRLDSFFPSQQRAAYEIGRGRRHQPGRYVFPVTIFAEPANRGPVRPRYTELTVARTGKTDWAVDKLP